MGFKVKVPNLKMLHFILKSEVGSNNIATMEYNKDKELKFGTMRHCNNLNVFIR